MSIDKNQSLNDVKELHCLLLYRRFRLKGFSASILNKHCESISQEIKLSARSIYIKVKNFEFIDTKGKEGLKNESEDSKHIYEKYHNFTITELEDEIGRIKKLYRISNVSVVLIIIIVSICVGIFAMFF